MSIRGKYRVCPNCSGEGVIGPGFVWTQDDLAQEDPEEFAEMQRDLRAGVYDQPCPCCKGKRVVTADDMERWGYEQEDAAIRRAEMGYMY